ncbi:MAG: hypothetical protein L0322_25995 [Chloroflexi bacterium]|nr:hypothetical protein [Chloroflexota bacterium]
MPDTNGELNPERELANIPAEYQEVFRRTIQEELALTGQNQDDTAMLRYLRRRRDDFKRGSFVRPDGKPGLLAMSNPEALYEQGLPELAQQNLAEAETQAGRRWTLIKAGALAFAALLFLFFVFRGRSQREAGVTATPAVAAGESTSIPTPPLPEISGAADALQTVGGLGGALTIGRPSAIELHYRQSEEVIALAIDPSQTTPRGELRYNPLTMQSANPVAVWIFGTVLNYGIGVPDSMVRNLQPDDRITLNTDTGASLTFVVAERWQGSSYEAGRVLSQDHTGLTLFALPAAAEDDVSFAFAHYDVAGEERQAQVTHEIGRPFSLGEGSEVQVADIAYSHMADGSLSILVNGQAEGIDAGQTLLLSLTAGGEQTAAMPIEPDGDGDWQTTFTLPGSLAGQSLLAEFRALPAGRLAMIRLGEAPRLVEQLQSEVSGATWDPASGEVVVTLSIHNPAPGAVYLSPEFIKIQSEGGETYAMNLGQVVPRLPTLIGPGETVGITVSFLPPSSSVLLQIGADLWAVQDIPDPTGQQP